VKAKWRTTLETLQGGHRSAIGQLYDLRVFKFEFDLTPLIRERHQQEKERATAEAAPARIATIYSIVSGGPQAAICKTVIPLGGAGSRPGVD
jgi:hypothetical protein